MKFLQLLMLFLLLFANTVSSQSKKTKKADALFEAGEYFRASEKYIKLYGKAKDKKAKAILAFHIGECNRKMNKSRNAEKWYKRAVRYKYQNPLSILHLAEAYKMNSKYDEALLEFEKYVELMPKDDAGLNGVESCTKAKEWIANPGRYIVNNITALNSRQSDYRPAYGKSERELFFTSTRESANGTEINTVSGELFSDLFFSQKDRKGQWSTPVPVDGINSAYDEGACSLNSSGDVIYFTYCPVVKDQDQGCKIYSSKKETEAWTLPEKIQIFADSSISVGHPCITSDELTLYFVAEVEGGFGGKDIWKITRNSKTSAWNKAENLGEQINTKGDEMYPFTLDGKKLFFSSNHHIGIGGQDIFKAEKDDEGNWVVENMLPPINSNADDFGIVFYKNIKKGFFSSTRSEGRGSDDIYEFKLPNLKFSVKGVVRNSINNMIIPEAIVKLQGNNGTSLEITSDLGGNFNFKLTDNTDYVFIASHKEFLKGKAAESTKGLRKNTVLTVEIFMSPIDIPIDLPNIEYDLGSWKLREESKVSLDKLIETLEINDHITIELGSHTDFRGDDESNLTLSQKRAQAVVDYLLSKGIKADRLAARGYGESSPKMITMEMAIDYSFLSSGDVLSEEFINKLTTNEQKNIAHQINRRTEFKVTSTDYKVNAIEFGGEN